MLEEVGEGDMDHRPEDQPRALHFGPEVLQVVEAVLGGTGEVTVDAGMREMRGALLIERLFPLLNARFCHCPLRSRVPGYTRRPATITEPPSQRRVASTFMAMDFLLQSLAAREERAVRSPISTAIIFLRACIPTPAERTLASRELFLWGTLVQQRHYLELGFYHL